MGLGSSLYAIYRVLSLSTYVIANASAGRLTREGADARARAFGRDVLAKAEVDLVVRGLENIPRDRPLVYMSNHQSLYDIPVLWAILPGTVRFVAKTELFSTPIWGRAMRRGEIVEVDRADRAQAIASLTHAAELIHSGVNVWIAPEGHRSSTGLLGPLKKGGFHLAKNAGADILPLVINGTIDVLPPKQVRTRQGKRVEVEVGRPIVTTDRSVDALMDEVRRFFETYITQERGARSSARPPRV